MLMLFALAIPSMQAFVTAIIVLVIVGVAVTLLERYVAIAEPMRTVIRVLLVIVLIVWLLRFFGLL